MKKEHILDVAELLFNQYGYSAVGVDYIRDTAKVSKTSIYYHFKSKNKLIEAVLKRRHQVFEDGLTNAITSSQIPIIRLNAIMQWHFNWFKSKNFKGCMFMHAIAEFKDTDISIAQIAYDHKQWIFELLTSIFDNDTQNTNEKASALMGFIEGIIIRAEFGDIVGKEELYLHAAQKLADLSDNITHK